MNTKTLLLVIPAVLVAGCGNMAMLKTTPVPGPTTVSVSVDAGPPMKCTINQPAKESTITVPIGTYDLTWNLQAPDGWQFDQQNGIKFPQAGSAQWFTPTPGLRTFVMRDNNNSTAARGSHTYHIHVENTAGSVKCKLDPTVINDDSGPSS